jgi:pimeloyl-ACP methyl ester carboxylesterase
LPPRQTLLPAVDIGRDAGRNRDCMRRASSFLLAFVLAACTTSAQRVDRLAAHGGLTGETFEAGTFATLIYMRRTDAADTRPVVIFFEGDPSAKRTALEPYVVPVSTHPIALELALRTPARVAYITRPCYHESREASCTLDEWTTGRYSNEAVQSLANSVREVARRMNAREVRLVGYSGGGTLAVLVAERLDDVAGVVTIAANLDTEAWTKKHDYPALTRSLNPTTSESVHSWPELHVMGARDEVVPPSTVSRYFERHSSARRWTIDDADHACCWVDRWTELWPQIDAMLRDPTLKGVEGLPP